MSRELVLKTVQPYGTLSPPKQQTDRIPLTKNASRREKFRAIQQALPTPEEWDGRDYWTGKAKSFEPRAGDSHSRILHEVPLGPDFKTPQWLWSTK